MERKEIKLAYALAVLQAVIIGISFLFVKMSLDHAKPLDSLTYRFTAAFAMMLIPAAAGLVKLKYRGKPLRKLLLLTTMYPIGFFVFQVFGLQYATSAEGGIVNAFTPVATTVFASFILKEETSLLQRLAILSSVFGVVFIFIMKGSMVEPSKLTGIALLLITCMVYAGYSVLSRSISPYFSPAEISYYMVGVGWVVLLLRSLSVHTYAGTLNEFVRPLASGTFLGLTLCLAVVQVSTALMSSYILSKLEASKTGVFIHLSTIVTIAAGALFLGEPIAWYHLAGTALIIAGVIGTQRLGGRRKTALPASIPSNG